MTLLTMCQQALREVGNFETPAAIVGDTSQTAVKLLALAQREGRELSRRHQWEELTMEHTFQQDSGSAHATNGSSSFALPTDFRYALSGTWWDRGDREPMVGPVTAGQWQSLLADAIASEAQYFFRIRGGSILVYPTPTGTTELFALEYTSKNWCESSGGTDQSAWAADTDVGILDEELMAMGLVWRFLKETGLPWQAEYQAYENEIRKATARSGDSPVLTFAGAGVNRNPNTPSGGVVTWSSVNAGVWGG